MFTVFTQATEVSINSTDNVLCLVCIISVKSFLNLSYTYTRANNCAQPFNPALLGNDIAYYVMDHTFQTESESLKNFGGDKR